VSRIAEVFGITPVVLPVVHPINRDEALRSVGVVARAGAKGLFLIDQGLGEREVLTLIVEVRAMYPALWIGVNLLSRSPAEALTVALDACGGKIDGIWSDNAGIDERTSEQRRPDELVATRHVLGWSGLYFGGVAFKYQRDVPGADLARAAALAANYMDVLCTSGPGTGQAADPEKLQMLHAGAGDSAIALASGVTAANAHVYVPYVDAFLVGTGIERLFGVIDEEKLVDLLRAVATPVAVDSRKVNTTRM
jgi:predicted TIM-barrel enzyme